MNRDEFRDFRLNGIPTYSAQYKDRQDRPTYTAQRVNLEVSEIFFFSSLHCC